MAKRVTMEMIARACDTSIGTVDRALNSRKGINAETRQRIMDKAEELGYRPNIMASALSRNTDARIAFIYPTNAHAFFSCITKGIQKAEAELSRYGIEIYYINTDPHDPASQLKLLEELDYDGYDAFAINPLSSKCTAFVDAIADSGKPVALFNNDLPSSRRLFYVGTDNSQCGRIAGEIMGLIMQGEGAVTVLGNFVHIMPFYERYEGFCEVIHDYYPNIDIFPSSDSRYEQDLVEKNIDKLLASGAKKFGIFSTGYSCTEMACRSVETRGRKDITLVGCDVSDEIAEAVKKGWCKALLYQDPFQQGYQTAQLLARNLLEGWVPEHSTLSIETRTVLRQNTVNYSGGILRRELFI